MARGIIKIIVAAAAALTIGTVNAATATAASDSGWVPAGPNPPDTGLRPDADHQRQSE